MSCDEYCSNFGCNHGRDCPARNSTDSSPARRARNLAAAMAGYALVMALLMCAAMAAASWLSLAVPGGS